MWRTLKTQCAALTEQALLEVACVWSTQQDVHVVAAEETGEDLEATVEDGIVEDVRRSVVTISVTSVGSMDIMHTIVHVEAGVAVEEEDADTVEEPVEEEAGETTDPAPDPDPVAEDATQEADDPTQDLPPAETAPHADNRRL